MQGKLGKKNASTLPRSGSPAAAATRSLRVGGRDRSVGGGIVHLIYEVLMRAANKHIRRGSASAGADIVAYAVNIIAAGRLYLRALGQARMTIRSISPLLKPMKRVVAPRARVQRHEASSAEILRLKTRRAARLYAARRVYNPAPRPIRTLGDRVDAPLWVSPDRMQLPTASPV
jgi:hypothetical protein